MSMQLVDHGGAMDHGTLLWIGDRDADAFSDAYDFCESHVSQLAYRVDLNTALLRPASAVRTILCCRDNDSAESIELFQTLCRLHADAKAFLLLGPLCAGARPAPSDLFDVPTITWHQWESFLPGYLRRCGWANQPSAAPESIAVVASSYANASALLSIASSGRASAVWCRPDQLATLRHFDEVWWDDSATQGESWEDLMNRLADPDCQHVWISGNVTPKTKFAARGAGVDLVIAKPGDFTLLIDRVAGGSGIQQRRAA
ncbi:hypothetical protein [Stieleria mannarensis]|uniref:hypothetical protein n=1 Tax=Stieleria mannarensis TaxID=2755585 RepID=UPI001601C8E2|nr:hypothetical protein [Rhodopirellula sp. JC639]